MGSQWLPCYTFITSRGANSTLELLWKNASGLWQGLFTYKATAPTRRIIDVMAAAWCRVRKLFWLSKLHGKTLYIYIPSIFWLMSLFNVNITVNHFYTTHRIISKSLPPNHSQTLKRRGISCGAKISSELEPSSILLRPSGLVVNIASREVPAFAGSSTTL